MSRVLAAVIILTSLLTGCRALHCSLQDGTEVDRDFFSSSRTSSDGFFVEWEGYREGFRAGSEADFGLVIRNNTDQPWSGRYCLQLLDPASPSVTATLAHRPVSLQPGVGFSDTITVQFPKTLETGAYGLSLVVQRAGGPSVDLVPIQVGVTDETRRPADQEDMDAALEACPPVNQR